MVNDTIKPSHNDHSYCNNDCGEEGSRLTETNLADSFNHREIAGTSTPYSAPVRRRLNMDVSNCSRDDAHEDSVEELIPLEDMEVSNCSRDDDNEHIVEGPIPLEDMPAKFTFWETSKNKTKVEGINKNHNYFYQVQGQLHVTRRKYCHFVMWTPQGMRIEAIERDDEFWDNHMEEKLKNFYMNCLLPELVDPRQTRSMPIRNPLYIMAAMEQAKEQRKKSDSTEKIV